MQQHQALRLALGSILTPKRPSVHQSTSSRPSSGAASPAVFYAGTHSASGSHSPTDHPTSSSGGGSVSSHPLAHGPNPPEHLHPYHPYAHPGPTRTAGHTHTHGHSHTHISLPPSRLRPGRSSPSNSPTSSAPISSYPSPSVTSNIIVNPDIEPLSMPPPIITSHPHAHLDHQPHHQLGGIEPPIPSITANGSQNSFHHPSVHDPMTQSATSHADGQDQSATMSGPSAHARPTSGDDVTSNGHGNGHSSGRGTPRAKFLEALQGKSAWDALIHGSFS